MDEPTALRHTAEEGQEIIGELTAALAVVVAEELRPCVSSACRGHLGPKAQELMNEALNRWNALGDEQVKADARYAALREAARAEIETANRLRKCEQELERENKYEHSDSRTAALERLYRASSDHNTARQRLEEEMNQ
jgi:hypothetical protein